MSFLADFKGSGTDYLCDQLFQLATKLARCDRFAYPTEVAGPAAEAGWRRLRTWLLVGTEQQFHWWAGEVVRRVTHEFFDYRDRVWCEKWREHNEALTDMISRFFRSDNPYPALVWASPVWNRILNAIRHSDLVREDRSCTTVPHGITSADPRWIILRFDDDETLEIDAKHLCFYYPKRGKRLLRTPRIRIIRTSDGRRKSTSYEEGLGLGDEAEVAELQRGNYSPNQEFYRSERGMEYLELCTLTLARLYPIAPSLRSYRVMPTDDEAAPVFRVEQRDAWVAFVRMTFHPVDMKIVVHLKAEREFDRFLFEHHGLFELLQQAFPVAGS